MTSRRDIEKQIGNIAPSADDEPGSRADLWRRFVEGEYDVETAHPQIQQWLMAIDRGSNP